MKDRALQRRAWRDLIARHLGDVTEGEALACLAMLEEATADQPAAPETAGVPYCGQCGSDYVIYRKAATAPQGAPTREPCLCCSDTLEAPSGNPCPLCLPEQGC